MVVLHYWKAPTDVRLKTVPELVKKVGAIKYGPEWNESPAWKYFPSFVAKDENGKKRRWQRELSFVGKKYTLVRKRLSVPPEFRQLIPTFSKEYISVCNDIRIAIDEGKLKGTIGRLGLTQLPLTDYPGVVTSQRNTVFCTGYVGIGPASAKEYGIIQVERKSEKTFLSGIVRSMAPPQRPINLSDAKKSECQAFADLLMSEIVKEFGDKVDDWPLFKADEPVRILNGVINGFIGTHIQNGQNRIVKLESYAPVGGYVSTGPSYSRSSIHSLAKQIFPPSIVARRGHADFEDLRQKRAQEFLKKFDI